MREYTVFTDGASKGNPGPGGYGGLIFEPDTVVEIGGREEHTTNNRMELLAGIMALREIPSGLPVTIYSDSRYVIQGITMWVYGWEKNGWVTKTKQEVLNKDLWSMLVSETRMRKVKWVYVAGHQGTPANERVDAIASDFAEGLSVDLYHGSREGYPIPPTIPEAGLVKEKKGPVYGYVSFYNNLGKVHKTWDECKAEVAGKKNVKYKKVYSEKEADELMRLWSEK